MPARDPTDEQLMEQVRLGDRAVVATLVGRWAGPLWSFLARMLGDRPRAEAMFQEVFLALWIHRRRYEYPRPFRIWLFEIAATKCARRLRQQRHASDEAGISRAPRTPAGPSGTDADRAVLLTRAVLRLPSRERTVLVLRVWNELTYADIAHITHHAEVLVRGQMAQALLRLRTAGFRGSPVQ